MTRFAPGTDPKKMAEITAAIQNRQNPKEPVPVKSSSGMGKPAPAAVKPPVNVANTGGPKPAPSPSRPIPGQFGYAGTTGGPKPTPVSAYNPKEGVGVTAATPRPLIQSATQPAQPRTPIANATGPMVPVRGGGMAPASVATMMKKGGKVKSKSSYSSGGGVKSTASKRGDGIAKRGKTKGRIV